MSINKIGEYIIKLGTGDIVNPGYRVYKKVWQSHRGGMPIKTPKENRRPRWKFMSVWRTEEKAELEIKRLQEEE